MTPIERLTAILSELGFVGEVDEVGENLRAVRGSDGW